MASPEDFTNHPVVKLIDDDENGLTMDEWLASLKGLEPIDLPISAAELVAEGRRARCGSLDAEPDERR